MSDLRLLAIASVVGVTAIAFSDSAATQGVPTKAPSGSLPADCQKRTMPTLATQDDIRKWLQDNYNHTTSCINTLKNKLDGAGKLTWEQANQVVDGIIKQAQDMLNEIEGDGGVRQKLRLLIAETKSLEKSIKTIIKKNPEAQMKRIAENIDRLEQADKALEQQAKGLSAKVFDLIGKKPEWALEWHLTGLDEIVKAILVVADGVSQHAEMLNKIEVDTQRQRPGTGN